MEAEGPPAVEQQVGARRLPSDATRVSRYDASVDPISDIDETAKAFFLAKVVNGSQPEVVVGGEQDGLRYFPTVIDGVTYWLTEYGLMPQLATPDATPC